MAAAYDQSPVSLPLVAGIVAGVLAFIALTALVLYLLYARDPAAPEPRWRPLPVPEAALQADPDGDWRALAAARRDLLASYGWVEREAGIAHIPIDQAMDRYLQEGWQALARPEELAAARERQQEWEALYQAAARRGPAGAAVRPPDASTNASAGGVSR